MSDDLVWLLIAANELEAEMVRSLLSTAGIVSMARETNFAAAALDGSRRGSGRGRSSSASATSSEPAS